MKFRGRAIADLSNLTIFFYLLAQLLPAVFKSQAWGILHTMLEMFCYRLHHIQPQYRMQLMSQLNSLATNAHSNSAQLHMW